MEEVVGSCWRLGKGGSWRMAEAGVRRREEEVGGRGWRRLENGGG